MCELLAVTSDSPLDMEQIVQWAQLLEELGVANYGWGMAWVSAGGELHRYRSVLGLRADTRALPVLRNVKTQRLFVHLRRPSLMTSQSHHNAQPYMDTAHRWTFGHNGFLERYQEFRVQYAADLHGTTDSEVGFQYCLEQLSRGVPLPESLQQTHQAFGGEANFMALSAEGELAVYAGNLSNPCYTFQLEGTRLAVSSLHSHDRYVFDAVFPEASEVQRVPLGAVRELI